VPSTLDFLQPEKTLEVTTDSLRDFIISLDKSKADKLRYKVEDDVVKIFITPYRTSISGADLEFTQGNFNVDVVVALGVDNKDQLDNAIIEHGQILHDAVVIDMSCGTNRPVDMGSINWHEPSASSLSEMLVSISEAFKTGLLDSQMATAFLTGIVAETERFSNDKTTPKVMTMSAQLMASGANQQLIANQLTIVPDPPTPQPAPEPIPELQPVPVIEVEPAPAPVTANPGELVISREPENPPAMPNATEIVQGSADGGLEFSVRDEVKRPVTDVDHAAEALGAQEADVTDTSSTADEPPVDPETEASKIEIDEHGKMKDLEAEEAEREYQHKQRVIQPLNTEPSTPKTDLTGYVFDTPVAPVASNGPPVLGAPPLPESTSQPEQAVPGGVQPAPTVITPQTTTPPVVPSIPQPNPDGSFPTEAPIQTLEDLERAVDSPHIKAASVARDAVSQAMAEAGYVPDPQPAQQAPPPVPPPIMPAFMPPTTADNGEIGLPTPPPAS
jgi:hypothetical protein